MKKTLFFELCASLLVVVLLAGFNTFAGKSSEVDHELSLLPGKMRMIILSEHRRHGRARRHHERSRGRVSDRRPDENHRQATAPQAAHNGAQPAPAPQPVQPPAAPAQPPAVR